MGAAQFTPKATILETCEEIGRLSKYAEEQKATADPSYIETIQHVIQQYETHLVEQCAADPDPQLQANILEITLEDGRIPEAASPPYKAALKALQDRIATATGKPYQPDELGKTVHRMKRELEWLNCEIPNLEHVIRKKGSAWTPPEMPAKLEAMKRRKTFLIEELAKMTSGKA